MAVVIDRWVPVFGFPDYEISTLGRIVKVDGHEMRPYVNVKGYHAVGLRCGGVRSGHYVHRLVLQSFTQSDGAGLEAAHANGIKSDNRLENLRWATRLENERDKISHGTRPKGERHGRSKLTAEGVAEIRARYTGARGDLVDLAREFGVTDTAIHDVVTRKNWRHVA